jgi:hypothetical protein
MQSERTTQRPNKRTQSTVHGKLKPAERIVVNGLDPQQHKHSRRQTRKDIKAAKSETKQQQQNNRENFKQAKEQKRTKSERRITE